MSCSHDYFSFLSTACCLDMTLPFRAIYLNSGHNKQATDALRSHNVPEFIIILASGKYLHVHSGRICFYCAFGQEVHNFYVLQYMRTCFLKNSVNCCWFVSYFPVISTTARFSTRVYWMHSFRSFFVSSCFTPRVRVSQASLSFCAILLTDLAPRGNDDGQCGVLLHLLSDLQCHLRALQPSHQPLLDYGEAAVRPHLLLTVPYYPSHCTLAKV